MTNADVPATTKVARRRAVFTQLRGLLAFLIVFALVAAVLIEALVIVRIDRRGQGSRDILDKVNTSTRILVDCTTPGHDCYERGKSSTADAVAQLNRVIVLASFCAKQAGNVTVAQIQACVVDGLR